MCTYLPLLRLDLAQSGPSPAYDALCVSVAYLFVIICVLIAILQFFSFNEIKSLEKV